jgi:IS30 family transposase
MGTRAGKPDLSCDERREIFMLSLAGMSASAIGLLLKRHHSTIRKELKKGKIAQRSGCSSDRQELRYDWYPAQLAAEAARKNKGRHALFAPIKLVQVQHSRYAYEVIRLQKRHRS